MYLEWWPYTFFWIKLFGASFFTFSAINILTKGRTALIKTRQDRIFLSSRLVSILHALGAVGLSCKILLTDTRWTIQSTPLQQHMMLTSLGYFIYDIGYIALFEPGWTFVLHHLTSMIFFGTGCYFRMGGYNCANMFLFGELTNPLQLVWTVCQRHKLEKAADFISPIFTWSFIIFRCLIMPAISIYHLPWMWTNLPINNIVLGVWTGINIALNITGFWWSYILWKGYQKKKHLVDQDTMAELKE